MKSSALQRAEIAEMFSGYGAYEPLVYVSVLFNEPKLLKCRKTTRCGCWRRGFSALQRAEIAEISSPRRSASSASYVSVLFNEPKLLKSTDTAALRAVCGVSVLFNEPKLLKYIDLIRSPARRKVSVLFNEPKLLKFSAFALAFVHPDGFSALQRAEIAEIPRDTRRKSPTLRMFQCSSTSRNC